MEAAICQVRTVWGVRWGGAEDSFSRPEMRLAAALGALRLRLVAGCLRAQCLADVSFHDAQISWIGSIL